MSAGPRVTSGTALDRSPCWRLASANACSWAIKQPTSCPANRGSPAAAIGPPSWCSRQPCAAALPLPERAPAQSTCCLTPGGDWVARNPETSRMSVSEGFPAGALPTHPAGRPARSGRGVPADHPVAAEPGEVSGPLDGYPRRPQCVVTWPNRVTASRSRRGPRQRAGSRKAGWRSRPATRCPPIAFHGRRSVDASPGARP